MSLLLDGVDDYAFTTDHAAFRPDMAMTAAVWVKRTLGATGIGPWVFGKLRSGSAYSWTAAASATSTSIGGYLYATGGATTVDSGNFPAIDGAWVLAVIRWQSGGAVNIRLRKQGDSTYLADVTGATARTGPISYDTGPVRIGTNGSQTTWWKGRVAHPALWSRSLTDAEVDSLAGGANPTSIASGLLEYFPLVASGGEVGAVAGRALTLMGGLGFDADNPTVTAVAAPDTSDPKNLAVTVSGSQLTYTWTASTTTGVTAYSVRRRAAGGSGALIPSTEVGRVTASPFVETGVPAGSYDCQVFGVIPGA